MNRITFTRPQLLISQTDLWAAIGMSWMVIQGIAAILTSNTMLAWSMLAVVPLAFLGFTVSTRLCIRKYELESRRYQHCIGLMMVDDTMIDWLIEKSFECTLYRYKADGYALHCIEFHDQTDEMLFIVTFYRAQNFRFGR